MRERVKKLWQKDYQRVVGPKEDKIKYNQLV